MAPRVLQAAGSTGAADAAVRPGTSFWTLSIDKRRVWKMTRWPLAAFVLIMAVVFLPRLWGWKFHCLGTGSGSWSMASDDSGALMPLSVYYVAKQDSYRVGDVVSFDYKGNGDPSQNGPSVKLIESVKDGTFRFRGLNEHCSVQPGSANTQSINGKVVTKISLLPRCYWRWLSLDWSLTTDQLVVREQRIFSLQTVTNVFTREGRLKNWVEISYPPGSIKWGSSNLWARESGGNVEVHDGESRVASIPGRMPTEHQWVGGVLTVIDYGHRSRTVTRWSIAEGEKVERSELKMVEVAESGVAISAMTPSNQDPRAAIDGNPKTFWNASIEGAWIRLDLGRSERVTINPQYGRSYFRVESSRDAESWSEVTILQPGSPSGPFVARYLRITRSNRGPALGCEQVAEMNIQRDD